MALALKFPQFSFRKILIPESNHEVGARSLGEVQPVVFCDDSFWWTVYKFGGIAGSPFVLDGNVYQAQFGIIAFSAF